MRKERSLANRSRAYAFSSSRVLDMIEPSWTEGLAVIKRVWLVGYGL